MVKLRTDLGHRRNVMMQCKHIIGLRWLKWWKLNGRVNARYMYRADLN